MHLEAFLAGTTATDTEKFYALIGALPTEVATLVPETIISPSEKHRFDALKTALLNRYRKPDHHHLHVLTILTLGDTRPSILWQQIQSINLRCSSPLPDGILRYMHFQKLPAEVKLSLSALDQGTPISEYVAAADRMCPQLSPPAQVFMANFTDSCTSPGAHRTSVHPNLVSPALMSNSHQFPLLAQACSATPLFSSDSPELPFDVPASGVQPLQEPNYQYTPVSNHR